MLCDAGGVTGSDGNDDDECKEPDADDAHVDECTLRS